MSQQPKISIITVTYNAANVLEATIQSIISQTFTRYEYLIIDGNSTDGTLDIIKKYASYIQYWVSEPDKGLYDAMNKGLQAATGEYVWFMNAGDEIYETNTLTQIFKGPEIQADIFYGDAFFFDASGEQNGLRSQVTPHQLPKQLQWKDMQYGMVVCHQSFIVRRSIAPLYNLNHPYSADVDWEIACLKKARNIVHTHLILSRYLTGGFSRKHLKKSLWDRFKVLQHHFGLFTTIKNHIWITVRGIGFAYRRKKAY